MNLNFVRIARFQFNEVNSSDVCCSVAFIPTVSAVGLQLVQHGYEFNWRNYLRRGEYVPAGWRTIRSAVEFPTAPWRIIA